MDYFFTEEQVMIRDLARKIAEEKIVPVREHYDRTGEFPRDIYKIIAEADLCGIYIPEEYGGLGGGVTEMAIATEQLSWGCGGIALSFAATGLGTYPILLFASEAQKKIYLPAIASGEKIAAFGLTESDAGSDAGRVRTSAVLDGNEYVLNGTKQWITNGGEADVYTIIATTQPGRGARGLSAFIVDKDTPGFTFGKKEDKMGIRASVTRELIFQDCRIPKENLLGKEGQGFRVAMSTLDKSRPGVASQAVGIAQAAFDEAIRYSKQRVQFDQSISSFQGIQFMLADMATKIEASRALLYAVTKLIDSGSKDYGKESAMVKVFASDTAMAVTVDAVQILGGYGYMKEYPVEKMMRDAKITQIYEGTNQIQRLVIARQLIRESAQQ